MRTIFTHLIKTVNVGDRNCCPMDYYPFANAVRFDLRSPLPLRPDDVLILGGGGMVQPKYRGALRAMTASPCRLRIAWGMGVGHDGTAPSYADYPELRQFDLVGVRDKVPEWPWVPCASCMSPMFDRVGEPVHEVVAYSNARAALKVPPGIPHIGNEGSLSEAIAFLASGRLIVTSSYHGAYWGMLLGRKVMVAKTCCRARMHGFPMPPTFGYGKIWPVRDARDYAGTGFLEQCREATTAFAASVQDRMATA